MGPSRLRFKVASGDAQAAFSAWLGRKEVGPPVPLGARAAAAHARTKSGAWRGTAFFFAHVDGWTVVDDLTGFLPGIDAPGFARLAGKRGDIFFSAYDGANGFGRLVVVRKGRVVRDFLSWSEDPDRDRDHGVLPGEDDEPIESWVEVAALADAEAGKYRADEGLLWIFR